MARPITTWLGSVASARTRDPSGTRNHACAAIVFGYRAINLGIVIVIVAPLLIFIACSFSNARWRHSALQLPKNNKMLNVVCSFIDFGDACIAIEPFCRVIGEIAITSKGLDRI
jgi:hypothetical protein